MRSNTPGSAAVGSGNTLEQAIVATLTSKGFVVVPYRSWSPVREFYGKELLVTGVPYDSIYGHKSRTEFLLLSEKYDLEIRIECKWQQVKGSVDEKLPYLYLNCATQMPERTIFIIIDGGGFKAGAVQWLRKTCLDRALLSYQDPSKEIKVMNLTEFLTWANKLLR